MNKIEQNINIETNAINNYCNNDVYITKYKINTNNFGTPDFVAVSGNTKICVEVKVRNVNSTQYPTFLIEKYKYDKMFDFYQKHINTTNYIPYYFNFFTDNKLFCFNLLPYFEEKIQINWLEEEHFINSNKTSKKLKTVGFLQHKDVHIIHKINQ